MKFANTAPASQIKMSISTVQLSADAGYGESDLRTGLRIGRITLLSDEPCGAFAIEGMSTSGLQNATVSRFS